MGRSGRRAGVEVRSILGAVDLEGPTGKAGTEKLSVGRKNRKAGGEGGALRWGKVRG